ncbi:hypothetical protein I552_6497 [Mycobacterium xenopi 3993]|nr:hypothetical protein I552_6497 [Mycobacterium xenopi 3993]
MVGGSRTFALPPAVVRLPVARSSLEAWRRRCQHGGRGPIATSIAELRVHPAMLPPPSTRMI